ncbi:hypothetical protein [Kordia sp.]|uniref:hypothetical protein n=1 Tax=Kordia sp. TaxID=1965332 RepID=UPI003B5B04C2
MVVLKKIKAATLMETLVATVLIVLVFMISTFLLNSLFNNTVRNNTDAVENHMSELMYLSRHGKISIPYEDELDDWYISIEREHTKIRVEASHKESRKTIYVERYE